MEKDKKRGRPSTEEKKKKHKNEKLSIDDIMLKVSNNMGSSFSSHNDFLQSNLPDDIDELFDLRKKMEHDKTIMTVDEIDSMINDNLTHCNGNDKLLSEIHQIFKDFVDDNYEDVLLVLLENFSDKVKILVEEKKNKVKAIIRKSIGIKMFPELKTTSMKYSDDENVSDDY